MTLPRWVELLPFIHFTRADISTLVLFIILGPLSGMLLFGFVVAGVNGVIGIGFWFAWAMGVMPKAAALVMVLAGLLPALSGGLAALAVRGFNCPLLYAMCAIVVGCGVQHLLLVPLLPSEQQTQLLIAAAGAAAICAAASYRIRTLNPQRASNCLR